MPIICIEYTTEFINVIKSGDSTQSISISCGETSQMK